MTSSKPRKSKSKYNNSKAISRSATKTPQLAEVKQSKTPLKDGTLTAFITPEKLQREETLVGNVTSPMTADTPKVSNNDTLSPTSTIDFPSCIGKRSSDTKDPFATHMDVDLLTG